jgi:hypothetical protein
MEDECSRHKARVDEPDDAGQGEHRDHDGEDKRSRGRAGAYIRITALGLGVTHFGYVTVGYAGDHVVRLLQRICSPAERQR